MTPNRDLAGKERGKVRFCAFLALAAQNQQKGVDCLTGPTKASCSGDRIQSYAPSDKPSGTLGKPTVKLLQRSLTAPGIETMLCTTLKY